MIVNDRAACDQCGGPASSKPVDGEHRCAVCRGRMRGYDEGRREVLYMQFNQIADLIEQDGDLDLIDLVAERVQAKQRDRERTVDLASRLRQRERDDGPGA
jgi:hypothetical protein